MVGSSSLLWHQYIADYCLHADKELVAKVSQAAKERMAVRKVLPTSVSPEVKEEAGEVSKKLAKIAGTGATIIKEVLRVKRDGVPELEDINTYKVHR